MTARRSGPIGPWKLIKASLSDLLENWKGYTKILAVVAVPIDLLGLSSSFSSDSTISAYTRLALLIMNVALIWAIVRQNRDQVMVRVHQAYYDSGIALVRFLVTTALLVLMLIPAAISAILYEFATAAGGVSGLQPAEMLLIGFACLILAIPSVWLLTRFGLAPVIVVATELRPIAAMRYARKLTLGHFWGMFGRYAILFLLLIAVAILPAIITVLLSILRLTNFAVLFFQLTTTFTAIPLLNIYIFKLYDSLEPKRES